jgi:hypothetical protein
LQNDFCTYFLESILQPSTVLDNQVVKIVLS